MGKIVEKMERILEWGGNAKRHHMFGTWRYLLGYQYFRFVTPPL